MTDGDLPPDSIDWPLVERYLAGETTLEEQARVAAWIRGAPGRREYVESLRTIGRVTHGQRPRFDSAGAWGRMRDDMGRVARNRQRSSVSLLRVASGARGHSWMSWGRWVAARGALGASMAAALVLAVAYGVQRGRTAQPVRDFSTPVGNRATLTLRDGTRLVLGPASHLRVPADFGRATRTVELDGEAFFAVVHDNAHPFAVRTARAIVRDVGTTFLVSAYTGDPSDRVAVAEGVVAVDVRRGLAGARPAAHAPAALPAGRDLTAGDVAIIDDTVVVVAHGADVAALTAWVQGGLAFADAPLSDVVRNLERTFDLTIAVADSSLLTKRITAAFTSQPPDEILTAITLAIGAQYERAGRRVLIRRRPAGASRDPLPVTPVPALSTAGATRLPTPSSDPR